MAIKTIRLPEELLRAVRKRAKIEGLDESTTIRQLIDQGVKDYCVKLYREGRLTLGEAAEFANVNVREMLDILLDHGVTGNVRLDQQKKSIELVSRPP